MKEYMVNKYPIIGKYRKANRIRCQNLIGTHRTKVTPMAISNRKATVSPIPLIGSDTRNKIKYAVIKMKGKHPAPRIYPKDLIFIFKMSWLGTVCPNQKDPIFSIES